MTYTEVAKQESEADLALNPIAHVSTIHSFLWTLIEPFQNDIWNWVQDYGTKLLAKYQSDLDGLGPRTQERTREDLTRKIQRLRNGLGALEGVSRFRYGVARNFSEGILGHHEILMMVPELILTKPLFARILARRYPLVFVDESQDTFSQIIECLRHVALTPARRLLPWLLRRPSAAHLHSRRRRHRPRGQ